MPPRVVDGAELADGRRPRCPWAAPGTQADVPLLAGATHGAAPPPGSWRARRLDRPEVARTCVPDASRIAARFCDDCVVDRRQSRTSGARVRRRQAQSKWRTPPAQRAQRARLRCTSGIGQRHRQRTRPGRRASSCLDRRRPQMHRLHRLLDGHDIVDAQQRACVPARSSAIVAAAKRPRGSGTWSCSILASTTARLRAHGASRRVGRQQRCRPVK